MNHFDWPMLHAVNGLAGRLPMLDQAVILFTEFAPELFGLSFLLLWFWPAPNRRDRQRIVVCAVLGGLLALVLNLGIASGYDRLRPFAVLPDQVKLLVPHDPHASLPSDHASGSFAFAAAMTDAGPLLGSVFWVTGAMVALSRLYVGVHWPTDLLASLMVGVISTAAVRRLWCRFGPISGLSRGRAR
ncbi:MAG TPA: phosphatase PAP2 family protein [Symbiobacteriaceae bacterium]|nr:phosphatase PAP2 family protein [Symbiobacteriaceae bacterium]